MASVSRPPSLLATAAASTPAAAPTGSIATTTTRRWSWILAARRATTTTTTIAAATNGGGGNGGDSRDRRRRSSSHRTPSKQQHQPRPRFVEYLGTTPDDEAAEAGDALWGGVLQPLPGAARRNRFGGAAAAEPRSADDAAVPFFDVVVGADDDLDEVEEESMGVSEAPKAAQQSEAANDDSARAASAALAAAAAEQKSSNTSLSTTSIDDDDDDDGEDEFARFVQERQRQRRREQQQAWLPPPSPPATAATPAPAPATALTLSPEQRRLARQQAAAEVLELARAVLAESGYDVSDAFGRGPPRAPCAARHQPLPGRPRPLPLAALGASTNRAGSSHFAWAGEEQDEDEEEEDDDDHNIRPALVEAAAASLPAEHHAPGPAERRRVASAAAAPAPAPLPAGGLDDPSWARKRARHAPYLDYLRGLALETARSAALAAGGGATMATTTTRARRRKQQQEALVALALAQAATADSWVQCSHLLRVFSTPTVDDDDGDGDDTAAATIVSSVAVADARLHAALLRRLSAGRVASPREVAAQSPAERSAYAAFLRELAEGARRAVTAGCLGEDEDDGGGDDTAFDYDASTIIAPVPVPASPKALAGIAYGAAALGAASDALLCAVAEASLPLLERQAVQRRGRGRQQQQTRGGESNNNNPNSFGASDLASLAWAFATAVEARLGAGSGAASSSAPRAAAAAVGATPAWRRALCAAALPILQRPLEGGEEDEDDAGRRRQLMPAASAAQIWGLAWGVARLGGPGVAAATAEDAADPSSSLLLLTPTSWSTAVLSASRSRMGDMDPDGLSHLAWAAAATPGCRPTRFWLRALCGALAARARSLRPAHLARAIPALAALGYAPRPEVARALASACRRHLHAMTPSQLALLVRAFAARQGGSGSGNSGSGSGSGAWHPGRLFLYEFCTHSMRVGLLGGVLGALREEDEEEQGASVSDPDDDGDGIDADSTPLVSGGWTGREAAAAAWSLARLGYTPDDAYLEALAEHLHVRLLLPLAESPVAAAAAAGTAAAAPPPPLPRAAADADALAMALYAFASMRRAPPPSGAAEWLADWCAAALARLDAFDAAALSTAAWALGELCAGGGGGDGDAGDDAALSAAASLLPPPSPSFMRAFTRRASVAMLGSNPNSSPASPAELAALAQALAALRWRPSDGWLAAFCAAAEGALPSANRGGRKGLEECATVLHALARLGAPLRPSFVRVVAAAARRRFFVAFGGGLEEEEEEGAGEEQQQRGGSGGGMRRAAAAAVAAAHRRRARQEAGAASAALALSRLAWALAQYSPGARPRAAAAWWRDFYAAWGGGGAGPAPTPAPAPALRRRPQHQLLLWRAASPRALAMLVVGVADALHPRSGGNSGATPAPLPPREWVDEGLVPALSRCFRAAAARPVVAAAAAEASARSRRQAAMMLADCLGGGELGVYLRQLEEEEDEEEEDGGRAFDWVAGVLFGAAGVVG